MIWNVARTSLLAFRRDRAALALTFLLPVVFFSIFAAIMGGGGGGGATGTIELIVVDEDGSRTSRQLAASLGNEKGIELVAPPAGKSAWTAADAEAAVRAQNVSVALVIPAGFGSQRVSFGPEGSAPRVRLLADTSDPVAPSLVTGLLQKAYMSAAPALMAGAGLEAIDRWSGGLTEAQKSTFAQNLETLESAQEQAPAASEDGMLLDVEVADILGESKKNPTSAFYAASVGVMFLLFSTAGAGGSLLEESENGTLDRVLSSEVGMGTLLAGKLLFLTVLGVVQLTVMFAWGALVFGVELLSHLGGFFLMAFATALAAAAFGLLLAALCRTRAQLAALSTMVILIISAVGGSMFPRFLMPDALKRWSLLAFNSWALDGFLKVFWREEPVLALWPQLLVLLATAALFFAIARHLARRWEIA